MRIRSVAIPISSVSNKDVLSRSAISSHGIETLEGFKTIVNYSTYFTYFTEESEFRKV